MKKTCFTLLLIAAMFMIAGPPAIHAANVWEGSVTIASDGTTATEYVDLANAGIACTEIDSIVVYNSGVNTAAVTVAACDVGVFTTLETFAPAAAGGVLKYPTRAVLSYEQSYVVTGNVAIAKSNVITNYAPYVAKQLRVTASRPSTNSASVFSVRVYGR